MPELRKMMGLDLSSIKIPTGPPVSVESAYKKISTKSVIRAGEYLLAEDVGLPELIYGTENKNNYRLRNRIILFSNKISESHTSKMETMNEIKIKQEEKLDADEEKLQQPITIIKNDIRFEDLQTFSKNITWKYPSKHSLEILKVRVIPSIYQRNRKSYL
ncbi:hypothetical protein TNCV_3079111 [Trichonephila clavipes]|nr:hypothetical protein TNCV_3079111 [Trichonephila clavipes]